AGGGFVVTWEDPSQDGSGNAAMGRLFDADGNALTFATDLWGRVSAVTDTLGRTARYHYGDQSDYLAAVEAPDGRRVSFEQDGEGRLIAVRLYAAGAEAPYRETFYGYDAGGEADDLRDNIIRISGTGGSPDMEMRYGGEDGEDRDHATRGLCRRPKSHAGDSPK
ncbi:MAG: hypothetical protein IH820_11060, partial [Bacteroidetes bacterium]|nr:hypothetical protein [Bacteroidota bacterium]